jgi:hypothetical protein
VRGKWEGARAVPVQARETQTQAGDVRAAWAPTWTCENGCRETDRSRGHPSIFFFFLWLMDLKIGPNCNGPLEHWINWTHGPNWTKLEWNLRNIGLITLRAYVAVSVASKVLFGAPPTEPKARKGEKRFWMTWRSCFIQRWSCWNGASAMASVALERYQMTPKVESLSYFFLNQMTP